MLEPGAISVHSADWLNRACPTSPSPSSDGRRSHRRPSESRKSSSSPLPLPVASGYGSNPDVRSTHAGTRRSESPQSAPSRMFASSFSCSCRGALMGSSADLQMSRSPVSSPSHVPGVLMPFPTWSARLGRHRSFKAATVPSLRRAINTSSPDLTSPPPATPAPGRRDERAAVHPRQQFCPPPSRHPPSAAALVAPGPQE
mmetsp:Transcript_18134/g.58644  ORF Transcript_18134/g.58644 Transcript_18134/m.58644 type:complete len:200 (+) Transcript_18134:951-1550(+)